MTKLTPSEEKEFREWYKKVASYKNLTSNPDDPAQYYDYRGFWKNEKDLRDRILSDDPEAHFIDKYKLPGHPTFSTESIYSTKETPGGKWEQVDGKWTFHHSPFTYKYADKTNKYLEGTGETAVYNMDEKQLQQEWKNTYASYQKTNNLNDFLRAFANNPDLAKWAAAQQEALEKGEKSKKISVGIDLLKNLGFGVAALNQIAQANSAASQLQRPSLPTVPGRDPMLSQALYNAQRGTVDPSATLSPATQGIQDAYNNALLQSQAASGGQAGAFQSLGQLANVQRMRASLGLAPMAQQAQLQNQQVYNDLLNQRLMENQNQFQNQYNVAGMAFDQYSQDAAAVGALGQSGRTNLYDSIGRVADTMGSNPYYLPFDDAIKDYMGKIKSRNSQNTRNALNSSAVRNPYQYNSGNFRPNYGVSNDESLYS